MTFIGTVLKGKVVLPPEAGLTDGTKVRIEPLSDKAAKPVKGLGGLAKKLNAFAGTVHGLPPDFAENHDHYIHGAPKR